MSYKNMCVTGLVVAIDSLIGLADDIFPEQLFLFTYKLSHDKKTAASVLLKPFICSNEWCHTTDGMPSGVLVWKRKCYFVQEHAYFERLVRE